MKKTALLTLLLLTVLSASTALPATNVWVDTFTLNVTKIGILTVSTNSLTIPAVVDEISTGTLTLSNAGNIPLSYTLAGSAAFSSSPYIDEAASTTQVASASTFFKAEFEPNTIVTDWTTPRPIGFTFDYGDEFSEFIVKANGTIQLKGSSTATITSGYSGSNFDLSQARYKTVGTERLVVAWGVDPNANSDSGELQIWLNADNTINILTFTDSGWEKRTVAAWIYAAPTSGTVQPQESVEVTFTFNAEGQTDGDTENFTAELQWNTDRLDVPVTVEIGTRNTQLSLPGSQLFSGPLGLISRSSFAIANSGDTALSYSISYRGQNSYTATQIPYDNNWISGGTVLQRSYTELNYPIVCFGKPYNTVMIYSNGGIGLTDNITIFGFWSKALEYADNATITLRENSAQTVVTWNILSGSDNDEKYTFQAIMNRDGSIRFNYLNLGSDWQEGFSGINNYTGTDYTYDFFNAENTILTTNEIVTETIVTNDVIGNVASTETIYTTNVTVTTDYVDEIVRQSALFSPTFEQLITASPLSGSLAIGESTIIDLFGDARNLTNAETNTTVLEFNYAGNTAPLLVQFIASNQVASAALPLATIQAMWGISFEPNISVELNASGNARTIRWPVAKDGLSHTYTVWYTDNLSTPFEPISDALTNIYEFTDEVPERVNNTQAFYKVSVE